MPATVCAELYLPIEARYHWVQTVTGIALGCRPERGPLRNRQRLVSVHGARTHFVDHDFPELTRWEFDTLTVQQPLFFSYEMDLGGRGIFGRSTPGTVAVLRTVGQFFGGRLLFQDQYPERGDEIFPKVDDLEPVTHDDWQALQDRMMDVKPVWWEQMMYAKPFAYYDFERTVAD